MTNQTTETMPLSELMLHSLEMAISLTATGQTALAIELLASLHWRIAHEQANPPEPPDIANWWPEPAATETT